MTASGVYDTADGFGPEVRVGVVLANAARELARVESDIETFDWAEHEERLLAFVQPAIALVAFGGAQSSRLIVNALADLALSTENGAGWDDSAAVRGALLSRILWTLTAVALAYDRIDVIVEFKRLRRKRMAILSDASFCFGPKGDRSGAEGLLYATHSRWFMNRHREEPGLLADRDARSSWIGEADLLLAMVCAHRSEGEARSGALADYELAQSAGERLSSRLRDTTQQKLLAELFDCDPGDLSAAVAQAYGNLSATRADGYTIRHVPPLFA